MGVDVAQDHNGIIVHTMSPVHRRGPVFYASLPRDTEIHEGHGTNRGGARRRLLSILWEHLVTMDSPLWESHLSSSRAAFPIQVVRDPLGKPHLLLGECRGPAISFSQGGGAVWAALCGDESDIGIDVAETDEFQGDYPFHRVFNAQELQHVVPLAGGDVEKASALLWSIKEAVVKALGCGFHLVEPRDICVHPAVEGGGEYTFPVGLSRKALERCPMGAGRSLWVHSLPQVKRWLSIAFLNGPRC
jgi:phosphopantetheinyl transferase (holo-ACP synthase)